MCLSFHVWFAMEKLAVAKVDLWHVSLSALEIFVRKITLGCIFRSCVFILVTFFCSCCYPSCILINSHPFTPLPGNSLTLNMAWTEH